MQVKDKNRSAALRIPAICITFVLQNEKKIMKSTLMKVYKVLRSVFVSLLVLFVLVYGILYLLLCIPAVQNKIKHRAETELSKLLTTKVTIGNVSIKPFNEVEIENVSVAGRDCKPIATIDKLAAQMSIYDFIADRRFVFDYAEVVGLKARLEKADPSAPLNIQFIIDALKSKDKNKPPTPYDVELKAVAIRKSAVTFDVVSEPHRPAGIFDPNHISVSRLRTDAILPKIKNDSIVVDVKRLALHEVSGFELNDLAANVEVYPDMLNVKNLRIAMPGSLLVPQDITVRYKSLQTIADDIRSTPLRLVVANSYITLADLTPFVPAFKNMREPIYMTCLLTGTLDHVMIETLDLSTANSALTLKTSGRIDNLTDGKNLSAELPSINLHAEIRQLLDDSMMRFKLPGGAVRVIDAADFLAVNGSLSYKPERVDYAGTINTALGQLESDLGLKRNDKGSVTHINGKLKSRNLKIGGLAKMPDVLNELAFDINADVALAGGLPHGNVDGTINYIDLKGYRYNNINADLEIDGRNYDGQICLHDPNIDLDIEGKFRPDGENTVVDVVATLANLSLANLNLTNKYRDYRLNGIAEVSLTGNNIDNVEGDLMLSDLSFMNEENEGINIDHLDITARQKDAGKYYTINSEILNGYIDGTTNFAGLTTSLKHIVGNIFPSLADYIPANEKAKSGNQNDFVYHFQIAENEKLLKFFNAPLTIAHPIKISGRVDDIDGRATIGIDAPYLVQGKKMIEKTSLSIDFDGDNDMMSINAVSQLDHKNGNILLVFNGTGAADRFDSDINWQYDRKRNFSGSINLSTLFKRNDDNRFAADIDINPTTFSVNDTTWHVTPARINIDDRRITVDGIHVYRDNQSIKANGMASTNPDDVIKLQLNNIDLGYIFETLNINHVAFSGDATGDFFASSLFTRTPQLNTPRLHVKNFAYHHALLGEADIQSAWDNENKGIIINADIAQPNKRMTYVRGGVYLGKDSLNFKFNTDHVNVKLLQPFMKAFTSDISGEASGECELYGTFKLLNVRGRMFADNFKMKLDYTNTYYTVSDSVILEPGRIMIRDAVLRDMQGNTAKLRGTVTHNYFHDATYDFAVTEANKLLCYDTNEKINPLWYGKVYANGSAYVKGIPGRCDIDINMSAARNSSFTFVLSDQEEAGEYSFITFTDKRKEKRLEEEKEKRAKQPFDFLATLNQNKKDENPSQFNLNLQVEANPNVAITMIMDPEGGDRIRATGKGNLQIKYSSSDEMKMFGSYTVDQGRYNFTLQDIIIREFNIKPGATIAFHGDPLQAIVDLQAAYSVNANLLDLDESFADDRELNRTLVPVNALLNLSGVISQPDISFDLEFPTLTTDVYRKVKSIVSTDDLMNQQILYLLALGRFYTPEYMGGTGRSNELASVASSTVSSQLTSMLGQISDNWTIAPNFHSDKGDFSDVEVELALSSRLLNNRLLLNGNFGYTDNAMNSNNFIGDFDIEYLLTKNGNFRLKAYNRYNDQNYYIRNALTTQGVGIMFKHDFNSFLRRHRSKKEAVAPTPADTTATK